VYLIWYGVGRSVFESIRVDPSEIFFGLRTNVWAALFAIVIGLVIILVQRRRHTGIELSPYLPGREWKPVDPEVESGETDSVFEDHGNEADEPVESRDVDATSTTDSRP